jgi:hypothetical protein
MWRKILSKCSDVDMDVDMKRIGQEDKQNIPPGVHYP